MPSARTVRRPRSFSTGEGTGRSLGRNRRPRVPALIVFDFDGVLTDNRVLVMEDGREAVFCHRGDGLGFEMLRRAGPPVLILSKERNPVVSARARKLRVPVLQGVDDKVAALRAYCLRKRKPLTEVMYVGNDLNDIGPLRLVGHPVCPGDSHPAVRAVCRTRLRTAGGHGVVREIVEKILGLRYADSTG